MTDQNKNTDPVTKAFLNCPDTKKFLEAEKEVARRFQEAQKASPPELSTACERLLDSKLSLIENAVGPTLNAPTKELSSRALTELHGTLNAAETPRCPSPKSPATKM